MYRRKGLFYSFGPKPSIFEFKMAPKGSVADDPSSHILIVAQKVLYMRWLSSNNQSLKKTYISSQENENFQISHSCYVFDQEEKMAAVTCN